MSWVKVKGRGHLFEATRRNTERPFQWYQFRHNKKRLQALPCQKDHESIPLSLTEIFASLFRNLCFQGMKKIPLLFQSEKLKYLLLLRIRSGSIRLKQTGVSETETRHALKFPACATSHGLCLCDEGPAVAQVCEGLGEGWSCENSEANRPFGQGS